MTEKDKQDIALLRYSIISPILNSDASVDSRKDLFKQAADRSYTTSSGTKLSVSWYTIERWFYLYRKHGFDALKPKGRTDCGQGRKMNDDIRETIIFLRQRYPRVPATSIYRHLLDQGIITAHDLSLSTLTRYVNALCSRSATETPKEMRRYEKEHINEVWYGDSCHGPFIRVGKQKHRTYIIALIDDASRMITGIDIFLNDNYVNLMGVIRGAILKYGKSGMFSFDNGKNYRNRQMNLLAARIGVVLHYCPPYTPTSKSKIERWYRGLRDLWQSTLDKEQLSSLDTLRESLYQYVERYNHTVHSSLHGKTPKERFFEEGALIRRLSDQQVHDSFLLEIERKVSADNVIVIDSVEYEVPYRYSRQKIRLRYTPDMSEIYVADGDMMTQIRLLDKCENSKIRGEKVHLTKGGQDGY